MRNLYQSPSASISHQTSYSGTSQIDTVQSRANQTSPKIIQVHHRGAHPASTCFINKHTFFQAHQSPKIKSIIQSSGYYNQASSELIKPPVPKAYKLSSSSASGTNILAVETFNTECNIKPSSLARTKNSSPIAVSTCSSSNSSSSSSSPVPRNMHEHQNERFFDSNTLYKKELKQKQRDILSTSISSTGKSSVENVSPQKTPQCQLQLKKLQQSLMKHEMERQISQMSQSHIQPSNLLDDNSAGNLSRDEKRSTLPHNLNSINQSPTSNNKVFNLFNNLLNRNKLEPNYLSIKNLKRATSSTQFTKSSSSKSAESNGEAKNCSLKSEQTSGFKMRRSFDDVARVSPEYGCHGDTFISLDNKKYQNTAFSTKNNGLIFLPQNQILDNYENLENNDTGSQFLAASSDCYSVKSAEYAPKPSDEILRRIGSSAEKNDDSNAFDNIVYSYVDNIRQHSKRLSEINLLQSSAIAAASAAAAAAVSSLSSEKNSQTTNSNALSCSSGSISSNSFHSPKSTEPPVQSYSNVMTLRDKFESIGSDSPKSSLKSVSIKSDGLSVNTSVSLTNKNNLNSPALSSVSSASSRSSAISTSLSSGSFSKDLSNKHRDVNDDDELNKMLSRTEKRQKNEQLLMTKNRIFFNYYFEFYRFNLSGDEPDDQAFKSQLENIKSLNEKLLPNYDKILAEFIDGFYANNVFLRNILDPMLADSLSTYSSNSSLFNFKFTIEFFRPILIAAKKTVLPSCSGNFNTESYQMIDQRAEPILEDRFLKQLNLNLYEFGSSSYSQLFKDLAHKLNFIAANGTNETNNFNILKSKLMLFILYKLEYFNDEIRIVQRASEMNEQLGVKVIFYYH